MKEDLIAPCGMNCGACSAYLAYSRGIPKKRGAITHCTGCRPREKRCAYLKGYCNRILPDRLNFCYECRDFPCIRLKRIDKRYRTNYNVSLIENLRQISRKGLPAFLQAERERYQCARCGGTVSIHNGKCYDCEPIERWRRR